MRLKTRIKNDLWHVNYIIPFIGKYMQQGKKVFARKAIPIALSLRVAKGTHPREISKDIVALMKTVKLDILPNSSFAYWIDEHRTIAVKGQVLSNFPLDYAKIINGSFNELADKAIAVGGDYGIRAENIKKAIMILRERTIEMVEQKCIDPQRKKRTIDELEALLEHPAHTYHDGLQRILFFNQFMWQTRHGLNGLGRLDKILGPLYEADIQSGLIDRESAVQMTKDFMTVLSNWYEFKSSSLLGDIGQIIILGGKEVDGSYFCNELTSIYLQAQAELKKPDPKTLIRVAKKMPEELLREAILALTSCTGSPIFSNDDVVIPRLVEFGIPDEDAFNYCVSACWEPFIPGKSLDQNNIRVFDFYRPLARTFDEIAEETDISMEKITDVYENELSLAWEEFCKTLDEFIWAYDPFVSMLTDGCNESGKDIAEGGALYNNYGVTSIGMGSVVDSLHNIDTLVFQEKKYTFKELNNKRRENYKNSPALLTELSNLEKYFGHDEAASEKIVNRFIDTSNKAVARYKNPLGGCLKFGLSSPFYIRDAKASPADFAGRKNGDPYGTHISCFDVPYTEIVNFAGSLHYNGHAFNGNVVDFFMTPGFINSNLDKFALFMMASIDAGFFQMQMNIVDSKTLIDAKSHPEKYPGLIVRVWGFSAYFNDLPDSYKDVLIKRAQSAERL